MRPLKLFLAACLCAGLWYARKDVLFSAGAQLAATPQAATRIPFREETRLEKLQHCHVASQLLEMELAKYRQLRLAELDQTMSLVRTTFRKQLSTELQATWDRMMDLRKGNEWEQSSHADAERSKENSNRRELEKQLKSFSQDLTDARTDAARGWGKQIQDLPSEKEIRAHDELIQMFTHERDRALAALR